MFAPTALMQTFFEYLEHPEYSGALKGKHCMVIALSARGGEKSALDYMVRVVWHLGGFVAAQIGLQARLLESGSTSEFADKITEDFYRAVHQKRQFIIPADFIAPVQTVKAEEKEEPPPAPVENTQLNNLSDTEEQEIDELSLLFAKKYNGTAAVKTAVPAPPVKPPTFAAPPLATKPPSANASAQKLTQNLPQCFQPQLSQGLQAVIQINITGSENFQGFLYIHSTECTYTEGEAPAPDIIIMADTAIWLDVLRNKNTAQKAFMIGGIKVRGDFVLLTKFDTLFNFAEIEK
jgi:putative sterol carrier protein